MTKSIGKQQLKFVLNFGMSLAILSVATINTIVSSANATTIPFVSDGALGEMNPFSDVVFYTDIGSYSIGGNFLYGGVTQLIGGNLSQIGFQGAEVTVYNFNSFIIPQGVTIRSVGSRPLIMGAIYIASHFPA